MAIDFETPFDKWFDEKWDMMDPQTAEKLSKVAWKKIFESCFDAAYEQGFDAGYMQT